MTKIIDIPLKTVGIILVAGTGSRLTPITLATSKALVGVFDKPAIYYAVENLMRAGIRDILIIAAPDNVDQYRNLLGDGASIGVKFSYEVQTEQVGIADAFIIGEAFIGNNNVALIFGDNIFSGKNFTRQLAASVNRPGATVFAQYVKDPKNFGIVAFDKNGRAISVEEKPEAPQSNYAIVGVYFYDCRVVEFAKQLEPSARGELEITDINKMYLEIDELNVTVLDSDTRFYDIGRATPLLAAAVFVAEFQEETGELLGSPEYAAYQLGYVSAEELIALTLKTAKSEYGLRLRELAMIGR